MADGFESIGRRRWLKWGLSLGGGAIALGGGGWLSLMGVAPPAGELRVLTDAEHRTLCHLVTTLLGPRALRRRAPIADAFDAYLATEQPHIVSDLKAALTWIELGPLLYARRWSSFSDLTDREREAHFRGWMEADDPTRRKVATAFRKFVNLVYYDDPGAWRRIHYPGPATGLRET